MKKYIVVIALMLGMTINADARHKKVKIKKSKGITAVTLSRGACFGRCPIYTLSIKNNGTAVFEGRNATDFLGTYQKQFTPSEVEEIFKRSSDYHVDTLQSNYVVRISDLPGLDLTFTINGKEKNVHNANFGPRFLVNLAEFIDQTVRVDSTWRKVKDLAPQK